MKRIINYEEELFIIFYSILNYLNLAYGFHTPINVQYELITGKQFQQYLNGTGKMRLMQIKYKYFSDKSLQLWDLCYAFFDNSHKIAINANAQEYMLAKNFNIIFEAMIDELIGTSHNSIPKGLADQKDGKRVDHIYTDLALTSIDSQVNREVYYIGDSKYYKNGHLVTSESIYKQYTYARNVIQWNLNLFMNGEDEKNSLSKAKGVTKLRDDLTEGYNIIPNFFISARLNEELNYKEELQITDKQHTHFNNRQFDNRLFDRDTLLVCHYDVNFLYVVSLYARNNALQKDSWKAAVREKFRQEIQKILEDNFQFHAMKARSGVNAESYIREHFQELLGKIYTPYPEKDIYSLALSKDFPNENQTLLDKLGKYFVIQKCQMGENPKPIFEQYVSETRGIIPSEMVTSVKNVFTGFIRIKDEDYEIFRNHQAQLYTMEKIPAINLIEVKYFLPMVGGKIDGVYKIERLQFGNYQDKEGNTRPCLKFKLGKYIHIGDTWKSIYDIMRPGEVISIEDIIRMYNKAK